MKPEPEKPTELTLEPLTESGTLGLLAALLRSPGQILHELKSGNAGRVWAVLFAGTAIALALFGVLIGTFSYGVQLWAAPVKIIGGVLFSAAICFPSLYIFGCLGGLRASPREIGGALAMEFPSWLSSYSASPPSYGSSPSPQIPQSSWELSSYSSGASPYGSVSVSFRSVPAISG